MISRVETRDVHAHRKLSSTHSRRFRVHNQVLQREQLHVLRRQRNARKGDLTGDVGENRVVERSQFGWHRTLIDGHEEFAADVGRKRAQTRMQTTDVSPARNFVVSSEASVEGGNGEEKLGGNEEERKRSGGRGGGRGGGKRIVGVDQRLRIRTTRFGFGNIG
jgi:hypothetical protein